MDFGFDSFEDMPLNDLFGDYDDEEEEVNDEYCYS